MALHGISSVYLYFKMLESLMSLISFKDFYDKILCEFNEKCKIIRYDYDNDFLSDKGTISWRLF